MQEEGATFFLVLSTMALAMGSIISGFSIKRSVTVYFSGCSC